MSNTAWVFPGQGSQAVGMGLDLLEHSHAQDRYQQAEAILGWSISDRCGGELETLSRTLYTQPCLYVISAILTDLLKAQGQAPTAVAGHSLGEFAALYAAGVFDFETGLRLVKRRAELMEQASGGKMVALVGFDRAALETAVASETGVVLANDNHADQVVISGHPDGIDTVLSQIKVKRALPLNVSGAFHSPFMAEAAHEFNQLIEIVQFQAAEVPVLSNVEPTPTTDPNMLQEQLMKQMIGPVRWREISLQLQQMGITTVMEVGPGKVLTGLVKRTCPDLQLINAGTLATVTAIA
jgi:[acyl-carrier-protein] S-malonyltransferase